MMGLHDYTFYDLISRNAVAFCNRPAWYEVDDQRMLNFADCKNSVDRLACCLQKIGLKKGDRIAALGKNSLEYFLLYGAAAALGAIVLPINWRLSLEEMLFNLNDCGPVMLFVDAEYQEMIAGARDKLPTVRDYYSLKPPGGVFAGFDTLLENNGDFEPVDVTSDDGLVIIHTAAVAGRPRGALLTHGNLISANIHVNLQLNLTPDDVHLNILPLFHVGGLFMATGSFHAGALNVNMSKFDAARAVSLIEEKNVYYLIFILDVFSRYLLGYAAFDTMYAINNIHVLKMAFRARGATKYPGLIHHSDKGSQYCSTGYIEALNQAEIVIPAP